VLAGLLKRRPEDIQNQSRITHPLVWFMVAALGTGALYGLYIKLSTPGFQGKWHISGRCIKPAWDWLGGCLVGLDLSGGGPAFYYVAERGQPRLFQYEGKIKRSQTDGDELLMSMPLNLNSRWRWKMQGEKLLLQFATKGPWVAFTKGSAKPKDGNFSQKPQDAGIPYPKVKTDPFVKKEEKPARKLDEVLEP